MDNTQNYFTFFNYKIFTVKEQTFSGNNSNFNGSLFSTNNFYIETCRDFEWDVNYDKMRCW